jgi:hypothetical protein
MNNKNVLCGVNEDIIHGLVLTPMSSSTLLVTCYCKTVVKVQMLLISIRQT